MPMRKKSIHECAFSAQQRVLLCGVGSGLDLPLLPKGPHYFCCDITPAMLKRAQRRAQACTADCHFTIADAMALPYGNNQFDSVVMHLILAVVPDPVLALREACRVLRPGGAIHILDKFLKPNERAWIRKMINPVLRHIATRTDVVFEDVVGQCSNLQLRYNHPAEASGWFRLIALTKRV